MPRPTAVSKRNQAVTTPPSSVGGSVTSKPEGATRSTTSPTIAATSSRPSTVLRFQVKETRSRQ